MACISFSVAVSTEWRAMTFAPLVVYGVALWKPIAGKASRTIMLKKIEFISITVVSSHQSAVDTWSYQWRSSF